MKPRVLILVMLLTNLCAAEEAVIDKEMDAIRAALKASAFTMQFHLPEKEKPIELSYEQDPKESYFRLLDRLTDEGKKPIGLNLIALQQMLGDVLTTRERPSVKIVLQADGKKHALYPIGLPETAHILKFIMSKNELLEWTQTNIKVPKDAAPIISIEGQPNVAEPLFSEGKLIDAKAAEAQEPLKLAKTVYEERRAELILQFNRSYLFYKAAEKSDWTVRQHGSSWRILTGGGDRMYYSYQWFQIEPDAAGNLKCVKIFAGEFFKGE